MTIEQILARLAEIRTMLADPNFDTAQAETLLAEVRSLNAQKAEIESRAAQAAQLRREVAPETINQIQQQERRGAAPTMEEVRASDAYAAAFLRDLRNGNSTECRALLSGLASGGQVPVPTFLEREIKTAWEQSTIMSKVKHSFFKGSVRVGFEVSATGATVHVEGEEAPDEETITLGVVTIDNVSIKKWITVSDEALEGTTVDTMGYLYAEISHKIVEKAEEELLAKISGAPAVADSTHAGVPTLAAAAIAADTIVKAVAKLSAKARNLTVMMNRQTFPAFVSVAMNANYAIDVFDGLRDRIEFTDALPAFSAASGSDTYVIIGDLGYGAQANFPNGDAVSIKVDDLSLAEKDLVKLVGRQYVGIGVVADKAFVKITK